MNIRQACLTAAALTITLSVTACTSDAAKPTPEPSATPSATKTPLGAPPGSTQEEVIRLWMDALWKMQNTGEAEEFLSLSTKDCKYCKDFSKEVKSVYAAGGSASVAPTKVRDISPLFGKSKTRFVVPITTGAGTLRQDSKVTKTSFPGGDHTYLVKVRKDSSSWLVHEVILPQSS